MPKPIEFGKKALKKTIDSAHQFDTDAHNVNGLADESAQNKPGARRTRSKSISFDSETRPSNGLINREFGQMDRSANQSNRCPVYTDGFLNLEQLADDTGAIDFTKPKISSSSPNSVMVSGQNNMTFVLENVSFNTEVEVVTLAETTPSNNESGTNALANYISVRSYEERLAYLARANAIKSDRIRELMQERDNLTDQLETTHNLNLVLTQTVDACRAHENFLPNDQTKKIEDLERGIAVLNDRVDGLNRRNFVLLAENTKLKTSIQSYSKNVLSEHNYNLCE